MSRHYRISASFLNAFLQDEAYHGFEDAVKRIPMKPNMFFEFGKWFENYIRQIQETGNLEKPAIPNYPDNTDDVDYDEIERYMLDSIGNLEEVEAKKFADELGKGTWQDHIQRDMEIEDPKTGEVVIFTLHGFTDFLPELREKIVDLKTTRVGKADKLDKKYELSIQHSLYCWILQIPYFEYKTYSTWLRRHVNKAYEVDIEEFDKTLRLLLINLLNTLYKKGLDDEFEKNFSVDSERIKANS